jgi:hypothetical protein
MSMMTGPTVSGSTQDVVQAELAVGRPESSRPGACTAAA